MAIREGADTDELHFKLIKPLLRRQFGISAVRIDEVHHNKNIDERILREIEQANLILADLTYERPSVYFEAGYAESKDIPVIYTCRADHFRRDAPHQVHFDLRQRNIVAWTSPRDRRFGRRLLARVRHTIAPFLRAQRRDDTNREAEAAFAAMSPERRITSLREIGDRLLRDHGFTLYGESGFFGSSNVRRAYRKRRSAVETVHLVVPRGVTKKALHRLWMWGFSDGSSAIEPSKARRTSRHVIIATESIVQRSRIEQVFQDYDPIYEKSWRLRNEANGRVTERLVHVIDGVRSTAMFRERAQTVLTRA
jgi:hypothetical protein